MYSSHSFLLQIRSYKTVVCYQNQEIEIDMIVLTSLQTLFRSLQFLHAFKCVYAWAYSSKKFYHTHVFV
jgi:hypothetical protein